MKTPKWKLLLEGFGIISALFGIMAAISTFLPKLSVDTSGSLRPQDPAGTVFWLSNDGVFPIHDVFVRCLFPKIEGAASIYGLNIGPGFPLAKTLSAGHKLTVPCAHMLETEPGVVANAELTILIDYRPDWVWWHRHAEFPMRAEKTITGQWIWKYLPQ
jgi:hypothetical protein